MIQTLGGDGLPVGFEPSWRASFFLVWGPREMSCRAFVAIFFLSFQHLRGCLLFSFLEAAAGSSLRATRSRFEANSDMKCWLWKVWAGWRLECDFRSLQVPSWAEGFESAEGGSNVFFFVEAMGSV